MDEKERCKTSKISGWQPHNGVFLLEVLETTRSEMRGGMGALSVDTLGG